MKPPGQDAAAGGVDEAAAMTFDEAVYNLAID